MITGNEPAMPASDNIVNEVGDATTIYYGGLTIRQYYAGLMMSAEVNMENSTSVQDVLAYIGRTGDKYDYTIHWPMYLAKHAVASADALINELNKDK